MWAIWGLPYRVYGLGVWLFCRVPIDKGGNRRLADLPFVFEIGFSALFEVNEKVFREAGCFLVVSGGFDFNNVGTLDFFDDGDLVSGHCVMSGFVCVFTF